MDIIVALYVDKMNEDFCLSEKVGKTPYLQQDSMVAPIKHRFTLVPFFNLLFSIMLVQKGLLKNDTGIIGQARFTTSHPTAYKVASLLAGSQLQRAASGIIISQAHCLS